MVILECGDKGIQVIGYRTKNDERNKKMARTGRRRFEGCKGQPEEQAL